MSSDVGIGGSQQRARADQEFDVFLSYNRSDAVVVRELAEWLCRNGIKPWLDQWWATPGRPWQDEIADAMRRSKACAVFMGPADVGKWEREEVYLAQDLGTDRSKDFRVFLVLLPGLAEPFEPSEVLPFVSMRTWIDFRAGLNDPGAMRALRNAVLGLPLGTPGARKPDHEMMPYRGLEPFDEDHAQYFFGREAEIQRLVEKLKRSSFLAVVGPSGSGKSSLVRAGLIPALRRGALQWTEHARIEVLRPGAHPLDTLTAHLVSLRPQLTAHTVRDQLSQDPRTLRLLTSRSGGHEQRVVWVVDQCEEVFTAARDVREREAFLLNMLHAATAEAPGLVIVALRADFYARFATYPELAQAIANNQYLVGEMRSDSLREAIVQPAKWADLELEPGLVDTILEDVQRQPGALPLLEHALLELWRRRRGTLLTLEGYRSSGGVQEAVAQRAEVIWDGFDARQREIARRALVRLTHLGEGAEDTRRRAPLEEILSESAQREQAEDVIGALADARLVTTTVDERKQPQVEVAHEALIRTWPRMRDWIDADRAGLRVHRRLTDAAHEWSRHERDPDGLYRGARLVEALEWQRTGVRHLNETERAFLSASQARRRRDQTRRLVGWSAAVVVVLAVVVVYAALQRQQTAEQRRAARVGQLTSEALTALGRDPELSVLLAREAVEIDATPYVVEALRSAITASLVRRIFRGHTDAVTSASFSPDGRHIVTGARDGTVRTWRTSDGRADAVFRRSVLPVTSVAVSPDGRRVASANGEVATLWDINTRRPVGSPVAGRVQAAAFSPDALRLVLGSASGITSIINAQSGHVERRLTRHRGAVLSASFDRSGQRVLTASADGDARVWSVKSGHSIATLRVSTTGPAYSATFDRAGRRIVTAGAASGASVWNASTYKPLSQLTAGEARIRTTSFSADGRLIVSAGAEDGSARIWQLATGRTVAELRGHRGQVNEAAFSPDGRRVVTASDDGTARLWHVPPPSGDPRPPRTADALLTLARQRVTRTLTASERRRFLGNGG